MASARVARKYPKLTYALRSKKARLIRDKSFSENAAVFPEKHDGDGGETEPIEESRLSAKPHQYEKSYRNDVKEARKAQRAGDAKAHGNRIEPLLLVKLAILERIDHIKSGEPEEHGETER